MNLFAYWNSDKMVLRMYGAQEVDRASAPRALRHRSSELAQRAELPMPRVYIIENEQPNAFATGRDPAERRGRRDHRPAQRLASSEEIAGVIGARAGACEEPRHADHDDHRDARRRHRHARATSACSSVIGNRDAARQSARHDRRAPADDPGADRRHAGADRDQPLARIRGRPRSAPRSAASRSGSPRRSPRSTTRRRASTNPDGRAPIRRPRISSSSTRCTAHAIDSLFSTHPSTENRIRRLQELGHGRRRGPRHGAAGPWG